MRQFYTPPPSVNTLWEQRELCRGWWLFGFGSPYCCQNFRRKAVIQEIDLTCEHEPSS